ncbi:MAG: hypothetical protein M3O50_21805 [Myxococcota bacterium]|nr:hypothetical protein [Myxococcota bacterium]
MRIGGPAWLIAAPALALAGGVACSSAEQRRIGVTAPDSSELTFGSVADYLVHRCGTLDCHGQTGRNLRVWGCDGMRLDAFDQVSCNRLVGGKPTTVQEHQATYRSVVGLEPSVMTAVVQGGGKHPELLTLVRKARGTEAHKGGAIVIPGDAQDTCITSWLAGNTDTTACASASGLPEFPTLDASE